MGSPVTRFVRSGPISWAMAETASKSPGDEIGKPASHTSTPRTLKLRAMPSFSLRLSVAPGDCSPSRSVVSKSRRRSLPASGQVAAAVEKARRTWRLVDDAERWTSVWIIRRWKIIERGKECAQE
uniref:Uncharacterized protein n=1 Tax=Hyaloperonospora arabidopsidis (strain Emoy2) TaxID=559515 RepID=M4BT40_HYAAE